MMMMPVASHCCCDAIFFCVLLCFLVIVRSVSPGYELYDLVDAPLYGKPFIDQYSNKSCASAVPYIELSMHSTDMNYSLSTAANRQQVHDPARSKSILAKLDAITRDPWAAVIQTSIGWLEFTIYDVTINSSDIGSGSWLCYDGKVYKYTSQRCADEDPNRPKLDRVEYLGGTGYDFHMVSEGNVRYWSPIFDNRDGTYSVHIRVDDPGLYRIDLLVNNRRGCHFADCDVPQDICDAVRGNPAYHYTDFVKNVTSVYVNISDSDSWPPYRKPSGNPTFELPNCTVLQMGSMSGRWMSPQFMSRRYGDSIQPFHSPSNPHPFVWQPYDCQLRWLDETEAKKCSEDHEFILTGLSRERTNFFDLFDFQRIPIHYVKYVNTDTVHNINYFSNYFAEIPDKKTWNWNGLLTRTVDTLANDLRNNFLCFSNEDYMHALAKIEFEMNNATTEKLKSKLNETLHQVQRKQHSRMAMLLAEENLWTTEFGLRSIWSNLSQHFIHHFRHQCINATVIYKTASALRNQIGSVSWQRMYENSRVSAKIARSLKIPVLDSFIMTQPWIMDNTVYPDGLHLFSRIKYQGNWVSKTVSMIFLLQIYSEHFQLT